ncbi:hypothetical protein GCM10009830_03580 [Glycomyces endophyticus]|uniref:Golgi phosphoprotein 3 GPP34 n=1 Tax=Glycomyces endophyticus TaxID=480996 RepID=A0ABP4RZ39_9ACTN
MPGLPAALALLAHDPATGRDRSGGYLDLGLSGAVLFELALAGRIDLDAKKVRVLDPAPTGDPLLDARLAALAADRPRAPHAAVDRGAKGLTRTVRDLLVETGDLRRERGRALGIFPVDRYLPRRGAADDARTRLASAYRTGRSHDERTDALLTLVAAVRLEKAVFPDRDARPDRKRLKALAEAHWVGAAVRKAIANRQGATAAAASGGGGG